VEEDGDRLSGAPRFVDNANGTITDNATHLMWEKKIGLDGSTNFANLNDADNSYAWAGTCSANTSKYCQPTSPAATLCTSNAEANTIGCDECTGSDGSCSVTDTVWTWAAALNVVGFGGHTDWRVPNRDELVSIIDYSRITSPAVNVAFDGASCAGCADITMPACSCTQPTFYWSRSPQVPYPQDAWVANFNDGGVTEAYRPYSYYVRAVRGGS